MCRISVETFVISSYLVFFSNCATVDCVFISAKYTQKADLNSEALLNMSKNKQILIFCSILKLFTKHGN